MKKIILIISCLGLLAACGNNNNGDTPPPPATVEQQTGVFTDGVISGAYYKTSSGLEGYTDTDGHYQYNQGDTVTFSIGGIQLGHSVTAKDRISPLDLSENNNVRTNIMILLQSLDEDGNHDNGIQIAEAALAMLTAQDLNFEEPPASFVNNAKLIAAVIVIDPSRSPVQPDIALNNFKDTFFKDITGVWVSTTEASDDEIFLMSIRPNGSYLIGEVGEEDSNGYNGIEAGLISWNPLTTELTVSIEPDDDTNGDWGLSDPESNIPFKLNFDGTHLLIIENGVTHNFKRIDHQPNTIFGAWRYPATGQIYAFLSNNRYFIVDSSTGLEGLNCGNSGIEYGEFSYTNNQLKATRISADTNGCVGFSATLNANTSYTIQINENIMSLKGFGEATYTLTRVQGYEAPSN